MTRNRTAAELFSILGTEVIVALLLTLAVGFAIVRSLAEARDRVRRIDGQVRKRALRRMAA